MRQSTLAPGVVLRAVLASVLFFGAKEAPAQPLTDEDERRLQRDIDNYLVSGMHNADWLWGELFYSETYRSSLQIDNTCEYPQAAFVYVGSRIAPYLSVSQQHVIVPVGGTQIDITITTPSPPDVGIPPPGGFPFGALFTEVEGGVYVYNRKLVGPCIAGDKRYRVYGHIHLDPDAVEGGEHCIAYWTRTETPPDGVDCTTPFRELAQHYVGSLLSSSAPRDPEAWDWLPSQRDIGRMTQGELIEMKRQATEQARLAAGSHGDVDDAFRNRNRPGEKP